MKYAVKKKRLINLIQKIIIFLGLIEAHNQFKATLGEADNEYKNIIHLVNDAKQTSQDNSLELTPNPYTNIQPDVSY
jgi:hypothetical protein